VLTEHTSSSLMCTVITTSQDWH